LRTKGSWKHRRTRDGERNREKGLKEKYRGVNWGDILRTRKKKQESFLERTERGGHYWQRERKIEEEEIGRSRRDKKTSHRNATVCNRILPPAAPPWDTVRSAFPCPSPPPPPSSASPLPSSIVLLMNSGEWIIIHSPLFTWTVESHCLWFGPIPTQSKKNKNKNLSKKLWFPRVFFLLFLFNIGLYFYTVKIQIRY